MANWSNTFGKVTIVLGDKSSVKTTIADVHYLLNQINENLFYIQDPTHTKWDYMSLDVHEVIPGFEKREKATYSFMGQGRYGFDSTISYLGKAISENPDLAKINFGLVIEFNDEEGGCSSLKSEGIEAMWHQVSEDKSSFDTLKQADTLEYTAENLIDTGFYDKGEIFDKHWIIDNFDEAYAFYKEEGGLLSVNDFKEAVNNLGDDNFWDIREVEED